jgi:hypothetical protein
MKTSIDPWKTPPPSSRHEDLVITRTRIGHSRLTHLHLITKENSLTCELCDKAQTIKHITLECPKFTSSRQILRNPSIMQQAFGEENAKNIYNFFKNTGLAKLI